MLRFAPSKAICCNSDSPGCGAKAPLVQSGQLRRAPDQCLHAAKELAVRCLGLLVLCSSGGAHTFGVSLPY